MKIRFPFIVKQIDPNTVEVQFGSSGKPLPDVRIANAPAMQSEHHLSEVQMDTIGEKAYEAAVRELVVTTITVVND